MVHTAVLLGNERRGVSPFQEVVSKFRLTLDLRKD